jgi:hypothetical protein
MNLIEFLIVAAAVIRAFQRLYGLKEIYYTSNAGSIKLSFKKMVKLVFFRCGTAAKPARPTQGLENGAGRTAL